MFACLIWRNILTRKKIAFGTNFKDCSEWLMTLLVRKTVIQTQATDPYKLFKKRHIVASLLSELHNCEELLNHNSVSCCFMKYCNCNKKFWTHIPHSCSLFIPAQSKLVHFSFTLLIAYGLCIIPCIASQLAKNADSSNNLSDQMQRNNKKSEYFGKNSWLSLFLLI